MTAMTEEVVNHAPSALNRFTGCYPDYRLTEAENGLGRSLVLEFLESWVEDEDEALSIVAEVLAVEYGLFLHEEMPEAGDMRAMLESVDASPEEQARMLTQQIQARGLQGKFGEFLASKERDAQG